MNNERIIIGDCREVLPALESGSVQTCVTSPPYWDMLDYGDERQLGIEPTPESYVAALVGVFAEVWRCLNDTGTLWIVIGDTYASQWPCRRRNIVGSGSLADGKRAARPPRMGPGLKDKDLVGIPWRLALGLQQWGWWVRSDIIWFKPNPTPDGSRDRPTSSHEHIFLLTKRRKGYWYNAEAIAETGKDGKPKNVRNVWEISPQRGTSKHPARFPEEIVRRCVLAGSNVGDTVLDPFSGSGTTGAVATALGRSYVGIELVDSLTAERE